MTNVTVPAYGEAEPTVERHAFDRHGMPTRT